MPQKKSAALNKKKIKSDHPTKRAHRIKDGVKDTRRINAQNRIRASITGTRNIDEAVHKLNTWLLELMKIMDWDNRERALSAYRATIHTLRDLLPYHSTVQLGAQLPLILKGIYYDGWVPKNNQTYQVNTPTEFYELIRCELGSTNLKFDNKTIQKFTHSIFKIMVNHMGENEMRKIKGLLRENVREIIPVSLEKTNSQIMDQEHLNM